MPCILKPGRHNFFVFFQGKNYCSHTLVDIRREEIPAFSKEFKTKSPVGFNFKISVFRNREFVTKQVLDAATEHDFEQWKVSRMTSKEDELRKIITQNFVKLNEIFLQLAASSTFPTILCSDFTIWAKTAGIFDSYFYKEDAEQIFNQVTENDSLNRCQFWEILVLIAQEKSSQGTVPAFEKLLHENILPLSQKTQYEAWQRRYLFQ